MLAGAQIGYDDKGSEMSGTIFALWLAVILCLVKAVAFFALAMFDRSSRPTPWFGFAFLAAGMSYVGELVLSAGIAPLASGLAIALAMAAMLVLFAAGLSERYNAPLQHGFSLGAVAVLAVYYTVVLSLPRDGLLRQLFYQLPYFLLSVMIVSIIGRARSKPIVEWLIAGLFSLIALQFLAKPFIAQWLGVGETPAQFSESLYGAFSIAFGSVLLLITATLTLGIMIYESARELVGRAERDGETGLLTRNSFTAHASRLIAAIKPAEATDHEAALILVALDRPASHGASAPLAALASVATAVAPRGALMGRMADGEMAILATGHSLFMARDTAEALRARFVEPLSIGITEYEPWDVHPQMLARALWALDEAQKAGGRCTRLAARSDFGLAPLPQP